MARMARAIGESGFYHVVMRGVGKQVLFEDGQDRDGFLRRLRETCGELGVKIVAWCLMSNHVHLLLRGDMDAISRAMRRVESAYASRFNARHGRTGTLFQGRFTSVPVESDEQLCAAVRYIHLNPVKAGEPIDGSWSSYAEYAAGAGGMCPDARMVLELLGGREGFVAFHREADDYVDPVPHARLSEDEAVSMARSALAPFGPYDVCGMPRAERAAAIARMSAAGLSIRQICRVTSLGRSIVERAVRASRLQDV